MKTGNHGVWNGQNKSAFVTSRLINGLPQNQISRLQHIQNTAARVITLSRKSCHITPILKELHWLPVSQRIDFKLMLIVHKSLNNIAPIYISELLKVYTPSRNLLSSNMSLLKEPTSKRTWGDRSFSVAAPRLWNHLPTKLKSCHSKTRFKSLLKTHLMSQFLKDDVYYFVIALYMYLGTWFCFCYHYKLFVFMFFTFLRLEHPAGWICALYKSLLLFIIIIIIFKQSCRWKLTDYELLKPPLVNGNYIYSYVMRINKIISLIILINRKCFSPLLSSVNHKLLFFLYLYLFMFNPFFVRSQDQYSLLLRFSSTPD